jgi:hypothetical protein
VQDQEFVTIIAKPAFWEGRMIVEGTLHGQPITGLGFVERNGFTMMGKLDTFFKASLAHMIIPHLSLVHVAGRRQ